VDIFLIATDVEGAAVHYGSPHQRFLREITLDEAERYREEGHFPPGSMGPKMDAAMMFLRAGGKRACVTSIESIEAAVEGRAGTEILRIASDV
jgi:carbamate kinase